MRQVNIFMYRRLYIFIYMYVFTYKPFLFSKPISIYPCMKISTSDYIFIYIYMYAYVYRYRYNIYIYMYIYIWVYLYSCLFFVSWMVYCRKEEPGADGRSDLRSLSCQVCIDFSYPLGIHVVRCDDIFQSNDKMTKRQQIWTVVNKQASNWTISKKPASLYWFWRFSLSWCIGIDFEHIRFRMLELLCKTSNLGYEQLVNMIISPLL